MLRTKYKSTGPCGFSEEDFFSCFPHQKAMSNKHAPGAWPFVVGRIYRGPLHDATHEI